MEVLFFELRTFIHDHVDTVTTNGKKIVLQWCRSEVGVNDVAGLLMDIANPFSKLHRVGNGGGEKNVTNRVREQDEGLLPHNTSFWTSLFFF